MNLGSSLGEGKVVADRITVHYRNPDFWDAIQSNGLDRMETLFCRDHGHRMSSRSSRTLWRDTIDGIGPVYMKIYSYRQASFRRRVIGSRAAREWKNSVRMRSIGLKQPETVLVATRTNHGSVNGSVLITREIPGAMSIESYLAQYGMQMEHPESSLLIHKLLLMIKKMHDSSFCHWDLKLRNILIVPSDQRLGLIPIDSLNGRTMYFWNRKHCVARDYRFLLHNHLVAPFFAESMAAEKNMIIKKLRYGSECKEDNDVNR